tara:strand:- start:706 stop:903 length:198 start_codon:yes stop_codon:yes gene_type:complete
MNKKTTYYVAWGLVYKALKKMGKGTYTGGTANYDDLVVVTKAGYNVTFAKSPSAAERKKRLDSWT